MPAEHLKTVDEAINRSRRLIEAAQQLKNILLEFPELRGLTVSGNGTPIPAAQALSELPPSEGGQFETIRDYFIRHSNNWITATNLAKAVNLPKTAVRQVIWNAHKDDFEKHNIAGKKNRFEIRLKGPK